MKTWIASLLSFPCLLIGGCAKEPSNPPLEGAPEGYVNEAKLPEGWPAPGPYGEVVAKEYPAYRAAISEGNGENTTFWKLFGHIQKNDIPMTAPVEMEMAEKDGKLAMTSMAFLYQNQKVGKEGADGTAVEVKDLPALKVLSYAWQGPRDDARIEEAKAALLAELSEKKLEAREFRLLGYNGPGVATAKRTHELQAVLK